jgi:cysteine desulfurase
MDSHATTPVDPRVLEVMLPFFTDNFGNASSIDHTYGVTANQAVEKAREQIAAVIKSKPEEIFFTSGATESDNIALFGVSNRLSEKGDHIITCVTEHKAILESCIHLEKQGKKVTYLPVDEYGRVNPDDIQEAITDRTILISIMAANNEIGTLAPLLEIGKIALDHEILFHTDAAQAAGHIPLDAKKMHIDLMSMSGHKIYGPKGVGVLVIRGVNPKKSVTPLIFGGGHERGIRPGTLNVPGIVGMGAALDIANKEMKEENTRYRAWTNQMFTSFQEATDGNVKLNGHPTERLAHNLNVSFPGVESKALIHALRNDVAISTGSACATLHVEPSHVLRAIGLSDEMIHSAVRFGLGRNIIFKDIDYTINKILGIKIK